MPLNDIEPLVAADGAEHRQIGVALQRLPQLHLLPRGADLVEDDSGDPHLRIEGGVALHQRRDPARHAEGVDDHDDRRAEQLRQGRARIRAFEIETVVQSLVALDQRQIGVRGAAGECFKNFRRRLGVEIEVEAAPPRRPRQPHRIDVVRTFLECRRHEPARGERRREPDRQRRLAGRFVNCRDEQPRHRPQASAFAAPCGRNGISRMASAATIIASDMPLAPSRISGSDGV